MEEEDKIAAALNRVLDERQKRFWIESEKHYNHHRELEKLLKSLSGVKKTFWTGLVLGFVAVLIPVVGLGILAMIKIKAAIFG